MKLPELFVQIPPQRIAQASEAARVLGDEVYRKFPFAGTTRPMVARTGNRIAKVPPMQITKLAASRRCKDQDPP